jgi:hypothetical protein
LSAHLQFLSGLCNLSIQAANDSVNQFLSSPFVTAYLLPQTIFRVQIDLLVERSKANAPAMFTRLLSLIWSTNHGNAIITAYGTNFEYIAPYYNLSDTSSVITQPVKYDNECSCALTANCTTDAGFIETNASEIVRIKGFKIGCTPSESFLVSTLECFYDLSCINLIQQYINTINTDNYTTTIPLSFSANMSRFSMNTTIIDLARDLFIENWSTTINYPSYFDQCSPISCSYTYVQQLNSLYTITILLGLYGGLTFVLKWICPNIMYLVAKIYQFRKKRRNVVPTIEMTTIERDIAALTPINVHNITVDPKSTPTAPTHAYTIVVLVSIINSSFLC